MRYKKTAEWNKLDNAAKIFPPASSKRDSKVFRFACELYEEVDPAALQSALEKTIEMFPIFKSVLRKGLFWYYLEESNLRPIVHAENNPPCSPIYDGDRRDLLFRVTYYRCRINFEVYHAITDGTGAMQFLRLLVYHYLAVSHAQDFPDGMPPMDYDASMTQREADSFQKYYSGTQHVKMEQMPPAYQIRGMRFPAGQMRVLEGVMSAKSVLDTAHRYNATMTAFLSAVMICAIHDEMPIRREREKIVLMVPVNLRKYFASQSARNFFSFIRVGHCFANEGKTLEEVVERISHVFQEELTTERLGRRMDDFATLEHNVFVRLVPLVFKDIGMAAANRIARKAITASISNIGRVDMPPELRHYIRQFDVFTSTDQLRMCMCSYQDRLVLSFTSAFVNTDIVRRFFRMLSEMGIDIEIVSSPMDEK